MNTFGIQRLIDSNQRVFGTGTPVYYIIDNFKLSDQPITDLGFSFTPSVTGDALGGTTSTEIDPPPQVSALSASYIASALQAGTALRSGARKFTVSGTWVTAQQATAGFDTPQQVFEDSTVEGLMYMGTLYTIVKVLPNEGIGNILSWDILCNAPDA